MSLLDKAETLHSSLIYKFSCGSYTASCIGKSYRYFKVRDSENQGVSPWTGKPVKGTLSISIKYLILKNKYWVCQINLVFIQQNDNNNVIIIIIVR